MSPRLELGFPGAFPVKLLLRVHVNASNLFRARASSPDVESFCSLCRCATKVKRKHVGVFAAFHERGECIKGNQMSMEKQMVL